MTQEALTCPSCGGQTAGPFCNHCSEKVQVDKHELTVSHFLKDTFEEVFNVDSKFVRTFRYLVFRPGFLTNEILAGKRINYIKPFRLYTIVVVIHFLAFSFFQSGDMFSIDRMPIFKIFPSVSDVIKSYEIKSGLAHDAFSASVNQKLKDNLNIIFYFLVFVLALFVKLAFYKNRKYYVEHLYFLLHLIAFGLIRNILLIPFVILDLMAAAFALAAVSQLTYTWLAVKNVYQEGNSGTIIKLVVIMTGFIIVLTSALMLSLFIALLQQ